MISLSSLSRSAFFRLLFTASFVATSAIAAGVELGNGHSVNVSGGFEVGNCFITNDLSRLKQVIGNWRVEALNRFTDFTGTGGDSVLARGTIDVESRDDVLSPLDLDAQAEGWESVSIGNVRGIKSDSNMDGIRILKYQLFRAPTQIIRISLIGPILDAGFQAFEKFQKTLETLEVLPQ